MTLSRRGDGQTVEIQSASILFEWKVSSWPPPLLASNSDFAYCLALWADKRSFRQFVNEKKQSAINNFTDNTIDSLESYASYSIRLTQLDV